MQQRRITFHDAERRYVLVPPENPDGTPQDLLLVFHGSLQSPNVIRRFTDFTFDALASCNTIVAYPGGIKNHFNDARKHLPEETRKLGTDDVGFTQAIIDELRKEYNIGRIFACGYSNGGQMVLRLLFDAPGLLSGAAVFAATLAAGDNLAPTNPVGAYQPTPLLMIHGTLDDKAPYEGGTAGIHVKRTRGEVLSAPATGAYFAERNGAGAPHTTKPYPDVEITTWPGDNREELWTVQDMGHVVPSGKELDPRLGKNTDSFTAAEAVAEFFKLT